ncbi:MAG: aminofutalosine synthase MqnE [Saprospiraceae bacterium]|nr:aminofutalosine synthase MqnE [Saprospiraceae bacterium]
MKRMSANDTFILEHVPAELHPIAHKVARGERITAEEGIKLFELGEVAFLGQLADFIRTQRHGDTTYFNKNFHVEPTNLCVFDCKFCAYSRLLREKGDLQAWEMSAEDIIETVKSYDKAEVTEVHIVGGVHPKMGLHYFADLIRSIKAERPDIHVKAFTAVELEYMCRKAKLSYKEGLEVLKAAGQDSLPGGGAEIFHDEIRDQICKDKCSADQWLEIHETAHELGMPSNATMLYGHIEAYKHRIHHMEALRNLQDKTNKFNAFIPLKYRSGNNQMSDVGEVSVIEDIKMYAVARIFMDNFPHIKAYWPMIGRDTAQLLLKFGVNDIDGTIDDTTKIYSMAGAEEQSPKMSTYDIVKLIKSVGKRPVERDSVYNELKDYSDVEFEEAPTVKSYN